MTKDEYRKWAESHAAAFGDMSPTVVMMLMAWWEGLQKLMATPAEMRKATFDILAMESRPIRMSDHYSLILQSVKRQRIVRGEQIEAERIMRIAEGPRSRLPPEWDQLMASIGEMPKREYQRDPSMRLRLMDQEDGK